MRILCFLMLILVVFDHSVLHGQDREPDVKREPNPHYVPLDLAECLDLFREREFFESMYRQAHVERTAEVKFILGILYQHGLGVPVDHARAARWYGEAEAAGYDFPYLGREAKRRLPEVTGGEPADPAVETREVDSSPGHEAVAPESDGSAQLRLATRYFYGLCAPMDYEKARDWEILAAENGSIEAMTVVAMSYAAGEYAYPKDAALAEKWRAALAEARERSDAKEAVAVDGPGTARALTEYAAEIHAEGKKHYEGDGVPVDYFLAGLRFVEAAGFDAEEPENYYLLGWIQENGLCGAANPYGAGKNYRIAAEMGHARAMFRLGLLHEEGRGVRVSRSEAEKWHSRAAGAGIDGAEERLRALRENPSEGRKEDWEVSPDFQKMLADAQFRAFFRHSVFKLPDEMRKATAMLARAAESGHPEAVFLYGKLASDGNGESAKPLDCPERKNNN